MWHKVKHQFSRLFVLTLCLVMLFWGSVAIAPGFADIRQQEEAGGQMLYQSRRSLRDRQGQTWQVVLFKRIKEGTVTEVNLRLVGYPDQTEFRHPAPLTIVLNTEANLVAADQFASGAPAPNVGQYDLQEILPQLPFEQKIQLELPLKNPVTLTVPAATVLEWKLLT
jgi:hypothetical protein